MGIVTRSIIISMDSASERWGKKILAIIILLVVLVLAGQFAAARLVPHTTTLYISDNEFKARVVSTESTREKGLSGTTHLPEGEAMLFVYGHDNRWGVWMKDMHYAIDVIWLDESKKVVDFVTSVSPSSYPRVYVPSKPARYIVEVPSGTVKSKSIRTGQLALFTEKRG